MFLLLIRLFILFLLLSWGWSMISGWYQEVLQFYWWMYPVPL